MAAHVGEGGGGNGANACNRHAVHARRSRMKSARRRCWAESDWYPMCCAGARGRDNHGPGRRARDCNDHARHDGGRAGAPRHPTGPAAPAHNSAAVQRAGHGRGARPPLWGKLLRRQCGCDRCVGPAPCMAWSCRWSLWGERRHATERRVQLGGNTCWVSSGASQAESDMDCGGRPWQARTKFDRPDCVV